MVLVKVLRRRDASSVVVAIAVGYAVFSFITATTAELANKIAITNPKIVGWDWRTNLFLPIVSLVLELVALEILCWVYVWGRGAFRK